MNDLDLDAIEARYAKAHFVDMQGFLEMAFQIGQDITALIAEVRQLREIVEIPTHTWNVLENTRKGALLRGNTELADALLKVKKVLLRKE